MTSEFFMLNKLFAPVPRLKIVNPERQPSTSQEDLIDMGVPITVGRGTQQKMVIQNEGGGVSREHLTLSVQIQDKRPQWILQAKAGAETYLKQRWGVRSLAGQTHVIKHGETFILGNPANRYAVRVQFCFPKPLPVRALLLVRDVLIASLGTLALFMGMGAGWMVFNWSAIPGDRGDLKRFAQRTQLFYDRNGTPLTSLHSEEVEPIVKLADIPDYVGAAVVASEDRRFYFHPGIDPIGVMAALRTSLLGGGELRGASTITQQLARSAFPDWVGSVDDVTFTRKFKEAAVALKLELSFSKDELLAAYLNTVYLGQGEYGLGEASYEYFGKSVREINIHQAAALAAILPQPNVYTSGICEADRLTNEALDEWDQGQADVLDLMEREGYFRSKPKPAPIKMVNLLDRKTCDRRFEDQYFPLFFQASSIQRELEELLPDRAYYGDFIVETTIDSQQQQIARQVLEGFVNSNQQIASLVISQGALVAMDVKTGGVLAIVDAVEPQTPTYAGAVDADGKPLLDRQGKRLKEAIYHNYAKMTDLPPASTFKLFAYTAALQGDLSRLQKIYDCEDLTWEGPWGVEFFAADLFPYSACQRGSALDMRQALAYSDNLVALKVAKDAGIEQVVEMAHLLGVDKTKLEAVPRLVLGQSRVSLMEMTGAYSAIANQGRREIPHLIDRIIDISNPDCQFRNYTQDPEDCPVLYDYDGDAARLKHHVGGDQQAVDPAVAQEMIRLLQGVVSGGTASGVVTVPGAGGKTGTGQFNDFWFIGFVPNDMAVGVWIGDRVGGADLKTGDPVDGAPTSAHAARLWNEYMGKIGY
jgi:peptidoglycan glycosyltransferase